MENVDQETRLKLIPGDKYVQVDKGVSGNQVNFSLVGMAGGQNVGGRC